MIASTLARRTLLPAVILLISSCQPSPPLPLPSITPSPAFSFVATATPSSAGQFANLGDITVYYEDHGQGNPLILLHGGMGSAEDWVNQIDAFSDKYRVITPDNRGQGRTTDAEAPLTYHLMAEDTLRLMDLLHIQLAHIVGWSDGGIIAIDMAINHPERVQSLVAYGASINPEGAQATAIAYIRDSSPSVLQTTLGDEYVRLSSDPSHLPVIIEKHRTLWLTQPRFTPEQLAVIRAPTLIIDGEDEEILRPEHASEIAAAISTADLVLMPDVGHYAPRERPVQWNSIVLAFLAKH